MSAVAASADDRGRRGGRWALLAVAGSLLGVFWSGYARVATTNFGGHDEWLLLSLNDAGILSFPYANRPLVLFWSQPVRLLGSSLRGYWFLHGLYLSTVGLVVYALGRRLAPSMPALSFLAAAFAVVWAPLDSSRLDTVALAGYSGNILAVFVAVLVFLESWRRSSPALLGAACVLALVATRAGELAIPLLAAAPLCLPVLGWRPGRRPLAWMGAWLAMIATAGVLAVQPILWPSGGSYQASALGFDPHPLRVAERVGRFFAFHLLPLGGPIPAEGVHVAVALALLSFALGYLVSVKDPEERAPDPRHLLGIMLGGVLAAALTYLPYALTPAVSTPLRTQMASAPGIGFLLAAVATAVVGPLPRPWRQVVLGLLAGWVVALGTARTLALQGAWDRASLWPAQSGTLRELVRIAPDLRPNTFVLLLDETDAWPATFTFRHAVDYLYGGHAIGAVGGAEAFLYPFAFLPDGVLVEPYPVIRRPWRVRPSFHRYDELVVVRRGATGLELLTRWPEGILPAFPAGATYDPLARIVQGRPAAAARAILAVR